MNAAPGPYTAYLDEDKNLFGIRDATGRHFATLDAPPRGAIQATADLLAASSEMYAALVDLLAELPAHIGKRDVKKHYHLMVREEAAKAAIAKAQGA